MKAPEKIYLDSYGSGFSHGFSSKKQHDNDIEYTRTDVIMNKTLEWLRKGGERSDAYIVTEFGEEVIDFVTLAEDLNNYIKEEV